MLNNNSKHSNDKRFNEPQSWLFQLNNDILVTCPQCGKCANVLKNEPNRWWSERKLLYRHCGHTQSGRKTTYTLSVKRNCPQCGKGFEKRMNNVSEAKKALKKTLKIACPHCSYSATYETNHSVEAFTKACDSPTDGYYGFPLWLAAPSKNHTVRAYNHEHLSLLQRYVSADLREKRLNNCLAKSMEQKLPKWMKLKKNREALLKVFAKLDDKLGN